MIIKNSQRWLGFSLLSIFISGCGSFADPTKWLAPSEIDPPAELQAIKKKVSVQTLWSSSVGNGAGTYQLDLAPKYANKTIYTADVEGNISALNSVNGAVAWSVNVNAPVAGGPGVGDGLVLLGTSDAEVIALDQKTGDEKWRSRVSSEVITKPVASLGRVIVRTVDGKVFGLDTDSGNEIWRYERKIPILTLRGVSAPVLSGTNVICGMAGGKLVVLNIANGDVVWDTTVSISSGRSELERLVDIDGDPLVHEGTIYVSTYQGDVAALAERSGRLLWRRKLSSYNGMAADNYNVYTSDADGFVWALDARSGAARWRQEALKNRKLSDVSVVDGVVAVGDFEGYMHFLSAEDGSEIGRTRVGSDPITKGTLVANDVLYVQGDGGRLEALTLSAEP